MARRELATAYGASDVRAIWRRTRALHRELGRRGDDDLRRSSAGSVSLGVAALQRVLAWQHALYAALLERGAAPAVAAGHIERVGWALAAPGVSVGIRLAGLGGGPRVMRVRRVVDALFATVFGAPFMRTVQAEPSVVAFDVTRCPLAEYLAARGVPELTAAAACSLDARMATAWGMHLERTGTLAQGAAVCDFRFVPLTRTPMT